MRKFFPLVLLLLCTGVASAQGQLTPAQAREAEWKSYTLPQTNFARQLSPEKEFLFRVPADWKQAGSDLVFNGPHTSLISVNVQKVPDGYPFQEYFASVLQGVRDRAGAAEVTLTRKTQLQDLEAREIFLEIDNTEGETIRSTSWITVSGPLAIIFHFQAPVAHATELEPFFKAVVQSVVFVPADYPALESLRSSIIKTSTPGPINEIEGIVADLGEATSDRESTINRLASLFATHADVTIDLLLDRRPLIRAAAVQALARTSNSTLKPFLWEMIDDKELIVAEAAARSVATAPDVVANTLKHSVSGYDTETIARVWPFMPNEKRVELLQMIFNKTATPRKPSSPPAKAAPKPGVTVKAIELQAVKPGAPVPDVTVGVSTDPDVQIGALTLLTTLPPADFKLPFARLMASNYNPLIAVGLQVAYQRAETLPVDSLFKLVASSDQQVSRFAAYNLGLSATAADIPRIEALVSKNSAPEKKPLDDALKLSIKFIRFRNELSAAKSPAEGREIIGKALADPELDELAWLYDCEASVAGCGPAGSQTALKSDFAVKPFAENLFPQKMRHYTAIPNPGQSVQRFYETLNGLQMDSPRAQASLILVINFLRQELANSLGAPAGAATLIEYTGIDPNAPIVMGSWTSDKALDTTNVAERKAIVLRVKDRARFERVIQALQQSNNGFMSLTDYVAIGTRAVAAFPAILPLSVAAVRSVERGRPTTGPLLKYTFVGENEWNGLRVKTIVSRSLKSDWEMESAATNIVFVGDTVIIAPDLSTIRDLLVHAGDSSEHLAGNPEFRKAVERRGDVVYFSDLKTVLASFGEDVKENGYNINESGALNITNSSWENTHHLVFEESDWSKPLLPFHPKELTAPRELLPASTIGYYLMKVDLASAWPTKLRTFFFRDDPKDTSKLWAVDFKQDVLPELGPECGAVLLDLPNMKDYEAATWAAFCKLKSAKLAEALSAGSLFTGVGPTKDVAKVKAGTDSYFVATRKGFLVVSNNEQSLAAFDGKSNLAETRDYSRAVEKVPGGIVAFGGYNLEAAIAAANKIPVEGTQAFVANMIGSVAGAFHSQNFYATASSGAVEAHSSVAMDREGRYPVADFAMLSRGANITFATLEPAGIPITDQNRMSSLVLKVRSKAPGPIENIRDDIKTPEQTVEQKSAQELVLTIAARRSSPEKAIELPVKDPGFAQFLKATTEFAADNEQVKNQAKQIAGKDRDAWTVARKLAEWTFKNLEWKHVASADAAQTLATREADCSEFSTLFVAMARSLGLPARMVTGLAYSGNSFGGHAWVEVWVGKWIELDPTWGTDFVDATHIRDSSNALVTSAALNLVEFEVLETKRNVSDFQKSSKALAEHLLKAIPVAARSDIEAAIDLPVLTDEFMGQGAWPKMNDGEKDKMWSAYRRMIEEIVSGYGDSYSTRHKLRLLHLEEKANEAEATCLLVPSELFLKLRLVRRNDLWYLVEVQQFDTGLYTASDTLQTTIAAIEKVRAGQKASPAGLTDFGRVLLLMKEDSEKALTLADKALAISPKDKGLRLLKALTLPFVNKLDESTKLLRELSNEDYAPAIYSLAARLSSAEDEPTQKEVVKLWERYTSLEPYDPRAFRELGTAYSVVSNLAQAEAAYAKAIELDPAGSDNYLSLILFLALNERFTEVRRAFVAFDHHKDTDVDLIAEVIRQLYWEAEEDRAVRIADSEPARVKSSSEANLLLGKIHMDAGRYAVALNHLNLSAQLDKTSSAPHVAMATLHRKQSRWSAALKAADHAISLDDEDCEAYYEKACALARLGRLKDAMSALEKSVDLDPDHLETIADEADLKPLSSLPAFKKLLQPPPEKP
ncbi:MAG TPA: transglutaminase domain-containing protein [Pyrinomonadaceae bacterium]|nr:transglutaminase domain-containing protein [Pyrinomonadaceae bacterium]